MQKFTCIEQKILRQEVRVKRQSVYREICFSYGYNKGKVAKVETGVKEGDWVGLHSVNIK